MDCVRRNLDFERDTREKIEQPQDRLQEQASKRKRCQARRRLAFGETEPAVLLKFGDLLPDRNDPYSACRSKSPRFKRIRYTSEQEKKLQTAMMLDEFPNRTKKESLAAELGISTLQVESWFKNRRFKLRHQNSWNKRKLKKVFHELPSPVRVVLPKPATFKLSFQHKTLSTICRESSQTQSLPVTRIQPRLTTSSEVGLPVAMTADTSLQIPGYSHRPIPSAKGVFHQVTRPIHQQPYDPLPATSMRHPALRYDLPKTPGYWIPPSQLTSSSDPPPAASSSSLLASEFPFSFSSAVEFPHIFGDLNEYHLNDGDLSSIPPTPLLDELFESVASSSSFMSEVDREVPTVDDLTNTTYRAKSEVLPSCRFREDCLVSSSVRSSGVLPVRSSCMFSRQD